MHHAFKSGDKEYNVELSRSRDGYRLHFDGSVTPIETDAATLVATRGDDVFVHVDGVAYHLHYEHPLERLAHQTHGAAEDGLRAPMPGSLVVVHAKPGQAVTKGEALLVMESMKMETTLHKLLAAAALNTRSMRDVADAVPDLHAAMGAWRN